MKFSCANIQRCLFIFATDRNSAIDYVVNLATNFCKRLNNNSMKIASLSSSLLIDRDGIPLNDIPLSQGVAQFLRSFTGMYLVFSACRLFLSQCRHFQRTKK